LDEAMFLNRAIAPCFRIWGFEVRGWGFGSGV